MFMSSQRNPMLKKVKKEYEDGGGTYTTSSRPFLNRLGTGFKELVRDVPVVGEAFGLESSADIAAGDQQEAILDAIDQQEQGYQRASDQLNPYAEVGGDYLNRLSKGISGGVFTQSPFSYGGQDVQQFDYQGSPDVGSIESYMGDFTQTPGYQARMDQGQLAIDRAAAAGGRFGGGQTAKDLMRFSQDYASNEYGNEYNRANQERNAALMAEQQNYGRARSAYGDELRAEQQAYGRATGEYGLEQNRLQNRLNQYTGMVNMGQQASGALANAEIGQGSSLADLSIQQGNSQAANTMANSNQLGQLLDLFGSGAKLYGAM